MKGRLFWKIFLGFWLTFMIITEGVWFLYEVVEPMPSDLSRALAKISLAAAATTIRVGGEAALVKELDAWPVNERGRLVVSPWTDKSRTQQDIDQGYMAIKANGPDGKSYLLSYDVTRFRFAGHGPFDVPPGILALAMAAGFVFSACLAWYLTKPMRQMQIGFRRLSEGDFSTRLGPAIGRRKDEVADLARGFDRMAAHLQDLIAARDRLLADVSHELRSPLARLQLAIDLSLQDPDKFRASQARIRAEASRLDTMVDELLTLSKLESGAETAEEYFDFSEIVRLAVEDASFEADPKGVHIETRIRSDIGGQDWITHGSGKLISRAVENILRNAVRFSDQGQTVSVTLTSEGQSFQLSVADQGPGVPENQLQKLFQPFVQGMASSGQGFGLGLSIAQRAVTALGGRIWAQNGSQSGFLISIVLPHGVA